MYTKRVVESEKRAKKIHVKSCVWVYCDLQKDFQEEGKKEGKNRRKHEKRKMTVTKAKAGNRDFFRSRKVVLW